MDDFSYRHAVVEQERRRNPFLYGDGVDVPVEEMSVRELSLGDPRREQIIAALDAKIARLAANSAKTPLRLSDALLKRLDRLPSADPPHPAGRDQPEPQPPAEFDDVPLPESVP